MSKKPFVGYLFFSLLLAGLFASYPAASFAQQYHIQTFREQDGVASNTVFNAAQDSLGNLWFGTRVGLTVFNGIQWQTISNKGPGTPKGEGLVSIDDTGVVWWVNRQYPFSVSRLKDGSWEAIPTPKISRKFTEIIGIKTWVSPEGKSVLVLAPYRGNIQIWQNGEWKTPASPTPDLINNSLAFLGSKLLLATTSGLLTLDLKSPETFYPCDWELPQGKILGVCPDPDNGDIWIVAKNWVAQIKDKKLHEFFPLPGLFQNKKKPGLSVCMGPTGGIYFADYSSIFHFHPNEGVEVIGPANGLATDGGNHVMMDREKVVWICSTRGISKIMSRRLACYNNDHGLLDGEVSSIIQRASGDVVLGQRSGLIFFDTTMRKISFGTGPLVHGRVTDLAEDAEGRLWIAANHQGLGLLGDDDSIRWYGQDEGLPAAVYSVLPHAEYGVFAGTSFGLFRLVGSRFEPVELISSPDYPNITIRRLVPLSAGRIAIASRFSGLYFWNQGKIKRVKGNRHDGSDNVFTVFEHPGGRLWVGTKGGLYCLEGEQLVKTTAPDPEISRPVYGIIQDDRGNFWFGTDDGATIWDGLDTSRMTTKEGLLGSETNRDALMCDSDGHVWIGTDSGLSVFRPEFDLPATVPPVLSLVSISINGELYPPDEPLKIQGPLASLVFVFHAPSFGSEEQVKFSAQPTSNSSVEAPLLIIHWPGILPMTNVPPGHFQVQIVGKLSSGLETNTIITPLITITTPLKDRWYTKAVAGLVVALVFWSILANFSGRRYARRLEFEVRNQTGILRNSEEVARLEAERLKRTLESISDGVVLVDGNCGVLLYNSAAEKLFSGSTPPQKGCPLEDILPVHSLIDSVQAQQYRDLLDNPAGVRLDSEQVAVLSGNNKSLWLEISAVPITGAPGGLVFAFRDITSRRHTEENERRNQKLESLGLLAGGIAHDFNNLLTIMMGNLSLAQISINTTASEAFHLEKVRQASKRAQILTRQLLTFAKGGGPVLESTNLASIIQDSVTFNLSGSNINCKIDIPDNLLWARVDTDQISQVIGNLVINAREAMKGGGQLLVSAKNAQSTPGFESGTMVVEIRVEDNGTGISIKDQANIFDPYFSTKESGTGLGLAIAHSIAVKHKGQLTVESSVGRGSKFLLVLPASEVGVNSVERENTANDEGPELKQLNVLFMDDEEDIRLLLSKMLGQINHQGTGVANGEEAREIFAAAEKKGPAFDLVILDLTIPGGMGGLEALGELRKINQHVKVIVTSGYSDAPVMAAYEKFGFSGILKKPFSLASLKRVIQSTT